MANKHTKRCLKILVIKEIYIKTTMSRIHILLNGSWNILQDRSYLFFSFAGCGPLTVVASPVAEHRLQTRRLSGQGSQAQPLRGMWDLLGPGHEPMSPASAGGLSTTAPPGKPCFVFLRGMTSF